jgi:hypothetical protein
MNQEDRILAQNLALIEIGRGRKRALEGGGVESAMVMMKMKKTRSKKTHLTVAAAVKMPVRVIVMIVMIEVLAMTTIATCKKPALHKN